MANKQAKKEMRKSINNDIKKYLKLYGKIEGLTITLNFPESFENGIYHMTVEKAETVMQSIE